jgi:hypothetical protein
VRQAVRHPPEAASYQETEKRHEEVTAIAWITREELKCDQRSQYASYEFKIRPAQKKLRTKYAADNRTDPSE